MISALASPHHDEAIEKILHHLGHWDPPWKRSPSARGPPPEMSPRELAEPTIPRGEDDFSQLRPLPDDEFDQDPFP